ncbi:MULTISPECIES: AAA family ATPase [unclassified Campylobacter]|uniref:AAA family ATPase n=1 Tax=unclassified Campylobacter TaxID=2593542 RepID=UPI0022E9DBBF|nr:MULTISPECIES: AAA family ATPase [unclassified Campylobacter]MDA3078929.1 AAA family ATPase [Campylobacter sp. CS_NA2]MDA3080780.1 AAA family ATPase [Campylobacter sp. CS_NA1]MDA3085016.1 AAA family ATPase [Campylobacter sp. CS_ED1]MDA3089792.1 AAA family ATPase [Campylobacter sp. CS_ED2]WBR51651.1 AAA family ATPase [Campylobacter sp. CS_NA3]
MLKSIEIENFRGIKSLKIDDFSKNVNVFIGGANIGKTSILEAIYIVLKQTKQMALVIQNIMINREMVIEDDSFNSLFYDYKDDNKINIKANVDADKIELGVEKKLANTETLIIDNNQSHLNSIKLLLKINEKKVVDSTIIRRKINNSQIEFNTQETNYLETFQDVEFVKRSVFENNLSLINSNADKKKEFKKCYQELDLDIETIEFIKNSIYVQIKNLENFVNIKSMGNGFQNYLTIISSILTGKKYIIIDEIENGMHFEMIENLIKNIFELSLKFDLQFFITTHSEEFLKVISKILQENKNFDVGIFSTYKNEEKNICVSKYNKENFIFLMENKNEIRW